MHTFLLSGCIVPCAFQKRKWNIAPQQRTVRLQFPFNCARSMTQPAACVGEEIRMHIGEEANEKRTLRASAPLFPPRAECSTIKSKKGGCGARFSCGGWSGCRMRPRSRGPCSCRRPRSLARAIMSFLFPVEGINVYNASKTCLWNGKLGGVIWFGSQGGRVFRAPFNPRAAAGIYPLAGNSLFSLSPSAKTAPWHELAAAAAGAPI